MTDRSVAWGRARAVGGLLVDCLTVAGVLAAVSFCFPADAATLGSDSPLIRQTVQMLLPEEGLARASQPGEPAGVVGSGEPIKRLAMGSSGTVRMDFVRQEEIPSALAPEMYSRGFFGRMLDTMSYYVLYVWEWATSGISPPSPLSFAQSYSEKDPDSFASLLADAGYKLGEIETDVGIVPTVYFKFKNVRQLSEADVVWLEWRLEKHAKRNPGWAAAAQRSIVHTLLEINEGGDFFVGTLKVRLLPLPAADFTLEPYEGGLPENLDVLLRAIQGKKISQRRSRASDGDSP